MTVSSTALLQCVIASLHKEFSINDFVPLNYFHRISVVHSTAGMFLFQEKNTYEVLELAHVLNCNPCTTLIDTDSKLGTDGNPVEDPILYHNLACAIQYLTFTRPDISYVAQQVCLFMHDPLELHFSALKRIFAMFEALLVTVYSCFLLQ